jgi:hypothetical protein
MKSLLGVMVLLSVLPSFDAHQDALLTDDGLRDFDVLIGRIRGGALGSDATDASVDVKPGGALVRLRVIRRGGLESGFTLLRPNRPAVAPRFFVVLADADIGERHTRELSATLDDVFRVSPWVEVPGPTVRWPLPGGLRDPVTLRRIVAAFVFVVLTSAAGLAYLLSVKIEPLVGGPSDRERDS